MTAPRYQTLSAAAIPVVDGVRVIAGEFRGTKGPANTFTPVTLLVVELKKGNSVKLDLRDGHSTAFYVGQGKVNDAAEGELALLSREGADFVLAAENDAIVFVMSGAPIDEPVVGYGPFVMNTPQEIQQAYRDYQAGKLGTIPTEEITS